jgi:ATP-binding cassette, subfamily C (CFTR/MRP), member 1
MTTVNLLNEPLNMLGQGLPSILAAYASLKRVQRFLDMDEKEGDLSPIFKPNANPDEKTRPENPTSLNVTDEKMSNKDGNEYSDIDAPVQLTSASFSWMPDSVVVLENISLRLKKGQFHMIIGSVASVRGQAYLLLQKAEVDRVLSY